ncbi:MAG TPA: hypothetical protein VMF69_13235 [Gemmataceae bacterium]|nr:hypothetical protein [Gemmataceae bacterium]
MKWFFGAVLAAMFVLGFGSGARSADDKDAAAILDKAVKALGGQEKLSKVKAATWKSKGKITFNGNDNEFTATATVQGLDHYRSVFEGEFNGNQVKGVTVLAKDKGWRQFGDNKMELDENALANEKRSVYLQVAPMTLTPLKDKGFKVESAGEKKVGDKPAVGLKVTGPDGKDFTLFFDKDSGLPVQLVAKVVGFGGNEFTQETTFADYKEFGGIKKATKVVSLRDGEKFIESHITEFKVLDKVDPQTFEEPK